MMGEWMPLKISHCRRPSFLHEPHPGSHLIALVSINFPTAPWGLPAAGASSPWHDPTQQLHQVLLPPREGHRAQLITPILWMKKVRPSEGEGLPRATQPVNDRAGARARPDPPCFCSLSPLTCASKALLESHGDAHLVLPSEPTASLSPVHYSCSQSQPAPVTRTTALGTCAASPPPLPRTWRVQGSSPSNWVGLSTPLWLRRCSSAPTDSSCAGS